VIFGAIPSKICSDYCVVRMGMKTKLDYIWKNGISISWQDSHALVTADVPNKIVQIRTRGSYKFFLLSAIRNDFRDQVLDKDLKITKKVSNDGNYFVEVDKIKATVEDDNKNVRSIHAETLEKKKMPVIDFLWALRLDEKADLKALPDRPTITLTPISKENPITVTTITDNNFIKKPIKVVTTTTTEEIYSDQDTVQELRELGKKIEDGFSTTHQKLEKVILLSNLNKNNHKYIESIFDHGRLLEEELFNTQSEQIRFYKKVNLYFEQLSLKEKQELKDWQNGDEKQKLKAVLNLGILKYERELEMKNFKLPINWQELKEIFYYEAEE